MQERKFSRERGRWITSIFFIISGILAASWASRIPDMQSQLALGNAAWGTVLFASPAGLMTGLWAGSWLSAHFGARNVVIGSIVFSCGFLVLAGLSSQRWELMVLLFLLGFARAITNISANTISLEVQQQYEKPVISSFHGLWSLACFIAASIGTALIVRGISPFHHFLGAGIICSAVAALFLRIPLGKKAESDKKPPLFVLPDRYLLLLGLTAYCALICENAMFDWSVNFFEQELQTTKGLVTAGYTAFIISMTFGRLTGDRLIGRFGPLVMLKINGLLIFSGFIIASIQPGIVSTLFGFILIGLGDSIIIPIIFSMAAKTRKMLPAYAVASVTTIGYLGFLTGPLLIGGLAGITSLKWAFTILSVAGLIIVYLAGKVQKQAALQ